MRSKNLARLSLAIGLLGFYCGPAAAWSCMAVTSHGYKTWSHHQKSQNDAMSVALESCTRYGSDCRVAQCDVRN